MKKQNTILSRIGVLLALIIVIVIMTALTGGKFMTFNNIMNVFRQTPMIALMGVGELCVILLGGIDLSVGAALAFSTCVAGIAYTAGCQNSFILILICLVCGALFGACNGLLLTKLHLPHPFIATLGTKNIYRGLALLITGAAAVPFAADTVSGVKFLGSVSIGGKFPVSILLLLYLLSCIFSYLGLLLEEKSIPLAATRRPQDLRVSIRIVCRSSVMRFPVSSAHVQVLSIWGV